MGKGKVPATIHRPTPIPPSAPTATKARPGEGAAECAASTCMLCCCCPLATIWCCVKIPWKVAAAVGRRMKSCACCGGGKSRRRILEASSSFSDYEFDSVTPPGRGDGKWGV